LFNSFVILLLTITTILIIKINVKMYLKLLTSKQTYLFMHIYYLSTKVNYFISFFF